MALELLVNVLQGFFNIYQKIKLGVTHTLNALSLTCRKGYIQPPFCLLSFHEAKTKVMSSRHSGTRTRAHTQAHTNTRARVFVCVKLPTLEIK